MTLLLALVARWGVPERFQRLAAGFAGVVAALLLLGALYGGWRLWLHRHDSAIVAANRKAANDQVANMVNAADGVAGNAQAKRDADFANSQTELKEKADAAADNGASPLDAVFDRLR